MQFNFNLRSVVEEGQGQSLGHIMCNCTGEQLNFITVEIQFRHPFDPPTHTFICSSVPTTTVLTISSSFNGWWWWWTISFDTLPSPLLDVLCDTLVQGSTLMSVREACHNFFSVRKRQKNFNFNPTYDSFDPSRYTLLHSIPEMSPPSFRSIPQIYFPFLDCCGPPDQVAITNSQHVLVYGEWAWIQGTNSCSKRIRSVHIVCSLLLASPQTGIIRRTGSQNNCKCVLLSPTYSGGCKECVWKIIETGRVVNI